MKGSILLGKNSNFKLQISKGDLIFFYNTNKVQETFNVANTNPKVKFYDSNICIVDKILSNNLIILQPNCKKPFLHKGDYFIGKKNEKLLIDENISNFPKKVLV